MQINPYLFFNGNCEEAFKFYESALGGKIVAMMSARGTPAEEHTSPEWRDKVMHARLVVGDQTLMASDAPPQYQGERGGFSVALMAKDAAEAERLFKNLSDGGQIQMALDETFFAERFGMLADKFGIEWMIVAEKPMSQ